MAKKAVVSISIGLCFLLLASACNKKTTEEVDNESQSVVDNAVAEPEYLAVVPTTQQLAIKTKGTGAQGKTLAACDTLTKISGDTLWGSTGHVDPSYTVSIASGACGLLMPDNRYRTGYLLVRLTNKLKIPQAKMIIKLKDYIASGIRYSCDSMVVTTIESNNQFTKFNVRLVNGVCYTPNWSIKYSFDRTITNYFNGNPLGTEPFSLIYGSASGINRNGRGFTVSVSESNPLVKHKNCQYFDKGALELVPEGLKPRTVDYGNGNCDDDATFTVNGNTIAFKLK